MKKAGITTWIFFFAFTALSQQRIGDFLAYDSNNGLPASLYYSVFQSSNGFLWLGCSSGLVRFDGKRYHTYFSNYADTNSLSDNVIVDIVEDNDQNLWMAGFTHGITKLDLRTGHFKRYHQQNRNESNGYGVNDLLVDKNDHLWMATAGRGLGKFNRAEDKFEYFIPDPTQPSDGSIKKANHITGIAEDNSDNEILWLSCMDGLYSFNTRTGVFHRYVYDDPRYNLPISFLSVEPDKEKLWLGTWFLGLMSFDKHTYQFQSYTYAGAERPNSTNYSVLDIKSVNDSLIYLAAAKSGLLSFDKKTHDISPLLTTDQLPDGSSSIDIQKISLTPHAGIFVGGNYRVYQQHAAFNRFGQSSYFNKGSDLGVSEIVYDHYRDGYWVTCMSSDSIFFYNEDLNTRKSIPITGPWNSSILDIAISKDNNVWGIGYNSGLLRFNEIQKLFDPVESIQGNDTIPSQVIAIESDKHGNLWLLTRRVLYYYNLVANDLEIFQLQTQGISLLKNLNLRSGLNDDAWVSSDKGLFHCDLKENKIHHINNNDQPNNLAKDFIRTMTIDSSGNIWLGYESDGIQVLRGDDYGLLASYNIDDGLPGMQINYMSTDTDGTVWIGTAAGLARFDADAKIWQIFNRNDGIKRDYIDRPILSTTNGKVFINIENGFSWFDIHDHITDQPIKPVIQVTALEVNGVSYEVNSVSTLDLPYDTDEIRIEFAAMDWLFPFRTQYFYRIDGIHAQDTWVNSKEAAFSMTGIKPGNYLIHIQAWSGDGGKSNEIEFPILIHPPYWKTWWFISMVTFCLLCLFYALYQYRMSRFKELHAMRNSISRNLHDDIGASLSNIHILNELTKRNFHDEPTARNYLSRAGEDIQRISESLSDLVWNINPKYDDPDKLYTRMKRYAADMMDGKNISAEFEFPEESEKLSMPMDQRRDLYLIFKEAINNLVKYSEATKARVEIRVDNRKISLLIQDNGKGFDPNTIQLGNGIDNMDQRANRWGGSFKIISSPADGTSVALEMDVR